MPSQARLGCSLPNMIWTSSQTRSDPLTMAHHMMVHLIEDHQVEDHQAAGPLATENHRATTSPI